MKCDKCGYPIKELNKPDYSFISCTKCKQRVDIEIQIGKNYLALARRIMRLNPAKYKNVSGVINDSIINLREKYREKYGK